MTMDMLQDAKRYAICIATEVCSFRHFAVAMVDYLGEPIVPYLKELYGGLTLFYFEQGLKCDDMSEVNNFTNSQILFWYEEFKRKETERFEEQSRKTEENIDELQFLIKDYRDSAEFKNMLDFIGKFHQLAPYNAMLVYMQKPGSRLVLKGKDWKEMNRVIKENAQNLITLRPFGPVQCMYDISDTEPASGSPMTSDEELIDKYNRTFEIQEGEISKALYDQLLGNLPSYGVYLDDNFNASSIYGGYVKPYSHEISPLAAANSKIRTSSRFIISVNRSMNMTQKFSTICHELGHIFCHHVSYDPKKERILSLKEREFEAETIAWLVCKRHGIRTQSEQYLATYAPEGIIPVCSTEFILKAVTEIEKMLNGKVYLTKSLWYKEDKSVKKELNGILNNIKKKEKKEKKVLL